MGALQRASSDQVSTMQGEGEERSKASKLSQGKGGGRGREEEGEAKREEVRQEGKGGVNLLGDPRGPRRGDSYALPQN